MSGFSVDDDDWDAPSSASGPGSSSSSSSRAAAPAVPPIAAGPPLAIASLSMSSAKEVPPGCNPNNPHVPYPTPKATELDLLEDAIIHAITTPAERMYALQVEDTICKFMKTTDLRKEMYRDKISFRR